MDQLPEKEAFIQELRQLSLTVVNLSSETHQVKTTTVETQSPKRLEEYKLVLYIVDSDKLPHTFFLILDVKIKPGHQVAILSLDFLKNPFKTITAEVFTTLLTDLSVKRLNTSPYRGKEVIHWEWTQFPRVWKLTDLDVETIIVDTIALLAEVDIFLEEVLPIDEQLDQINQQLKDSISRLL